jgi:hypothetical protein
MKTNVFVFFFIDFFFFCFITESTTIGSTKGIENLTLFLLHQEKMWNTQHNSNNRDTIHKSSGATLPTTATATTATGTAKTISTTA